MKAPRRPQPAREPVGPRQRSRGQARPLASPHAERDPGRWLARLISALLVALALTACQAAALEPAEPAAPSPSPAPLRVEPTPTATTEPAAPSPSPAPLRADPTPTATTEPAAAPAAAVEVSGERSLADVEWLSTSIGSRPAGSSAERLAAEGLADRLRQLGYEVEVQPVPIRRFEDRGSRLRVAGEPPDDVPARALVNSASGRAEGPLVDVGLGRPEDLAGRDLRGAVALVARGEIPFTDKVRNVAAAGAVAAAIYNRDDGPFQGVVAEGSAIPVVALAGADGRALVQRLDQGPLTASVEVDAAVVEGTSQNVVGKLRSPSERTVVLGAHYDSVPAGPGANDNASGTATVLELARVLGARGSPLGVTVVFFGAEEIGLVGSRAYVASLSPAERGRIVAMLNFDMVGVGDQLSVAGSEDLIQLASSLPAPDGTRLGRIDDRQVGMSSDHASFLQAGIPAVFFYRSEDPRYHSPDDRAEHVDARHLETAGSLGLALLPALAAR